MPESLIASPLTAAVLNHLLPCLISVLTALVAWQGFRRLHEEMLHDAALAFTVAAIVHAAILAAQAAGQSLPLPILGVLDCASTALIGWVFLVRARSTFLVMTLTLCGMFSAFILSIWQLSGVEPDWSAQAWWLIGSIILGAVTVLLWQLGRERPVLLLAAFLLLTSGYLTGAAGQSEGPVLARLGALPLMTVALTQISTRELEGVQSELASFSEYSLRQTQQLLTLLHASTALISHSDVNAVLDEAVEGVALGVGADNAFAALLDEKKTNTLHIKAVYPPRPSLRDAVVRLDAQPAISQALRLGQQLALEASHPSTRSLADLMKTGAGPAIVQPLTTQERTLGVLVAMNGRHGREFTESEQRVMEAFGAQVATAAENALLAQVVKETTQELAKLLAMRQEEASRQKAILESIADGVIVFDHGGQAIAANPAARTILDLDQTGLLGSPVGSILGGHIHPDDYVSIQMLFEGKLPAIHALKIKHGNKTISISIAPIDLSSSAANRHGTVMVLHDITEDARVDQLKTEFVSVVSHELRTPFAMLDSSIEVIRRYGLDHLLPEQRVQMQQLGEGLKRAETMVNNLVTFASFLSKQGQLRMTILDLGQLARSAAEELMPMARARDVEMKLEVASDLPQVYGDRERLAEAIYHLAHNAIKFNRQGGAVVLSCRSSPEGVILEVVDTGVGIAPEKLAGVWKDFYQLADPLKRGVEGLGLGLPLVNYVIQAHNGQVWADSKEGQGSVFGFLLPAVSRNP